MFNENLESIGQNMAEKSEYFTSEKDRFKGKNIPLRQGSGSIPPELEFLISEELAKDEDSGFVSGVENIRISEQRLKKAEEKFSVLKKSNPDTEPMIVYGSVARREAKKESDTDEVFASAFLGKHIALFASYEIVGAEENGKNKIHRDIDDKRKVEIMNFLKRYEGKKVSSTDIIIDYVQENAMIGARARIKNHSYETEEARLIKSITVRFIETLNKLADEGKIKKYGFHRFRLPAENNKTNNE